MKLVVNHGLDDPQRVRTVIEKAYESYQKRLADYNPRLKWLSDNEARVSFSVMSKSLGANFKIAGSDVVIAGDIPFIFRPFRKKIEKVLREEVEQWAAKAKKGEI